MVNPVPSSGNPYNSAKDCGGSSGGEGALIGGGGSILGLGNDDGGSLRCPAALCGAYSLKPTYGRHASNIGLVGWKPTPYLNCVSGFISADVDGLVQASKAIYNSVDQLNPNDISTTPLTWRDTIFASDNKLRIGYSLDFGNYKVHPGVARAVVETTMMLANAGHEVVEFAAPDIETICAHFSGFMFSQDIQDLIDVLEKDVIIDSSVAETLNYCYILKYCPKFVQMNVINPILSWFTSAKLYPSYDSMSVLAQKTEECNEFAQRYVDKMNDAKIDLLLVPSSLIPAPNKGLLGKLPTSAIPYCTWNTLNFPAGIVPITNVTPEDQAKMDEAMPSSDALNRMIKDACIDSEGLPLSVQVVGRRFDEEKVLRLMSELERMTGYKQLKERTG